MKNFTSALGILLISILLFLLIPEIFDWVSTGRFQITLKDLRAAVFVGIFTPVVVYFSKRIKDDKTFILVLVVIIVVLISLVSFLK